MCVAQWLDGGQNQLPLLPASSDLLLLPGQTSWIELQPQREAVFEIARNSHFSCLGLPVSGSASPTAVRDTVVTVLEMSSQPPDAVMQKPAAHTQRSLISSHCVCAPSQAENLHVPPWCTPWHGALLG